ncbi:hypothetical protein CapIbe_000012 [Capra ibex]
MTESLEDLRKIERTQGRMEEKKNQRGQCPMTAKFSTDEHCADSRAQTVKSGHGPRHSRTCGCKRVSHKTGTMPLIHKLDLPYTQRASKGPLQLVCAETSIPALVSKIINE